MGKLGHSIDDAYRNATSGQVAREREAGRAGAHHKNIGLRHSEHLIVTRLKKQPSNECYPVRVVEPTGLRARKKARTRDAIADAAISLFLAHGFDQVSVADIAARAEVSKPTLFRYFTAKEDLVLHRIADHNGEAARVVRDRQPGVSPLTALHRHFRAGLDRRDPVTGLNDHPEVLAFHRLVFTTPSLAGRLIQYTLDNEETLAAALGGDITARLQAAQVLAVQRVLARTTWEKLVAGQTADDVYPEAVADADRAFALLQTGTGDATGAGS